MNGSTVRILLVEDEQQLREELADFFEARGCEVATAGDVAAAHAVLAGTDQQWRVLSDIRLPDVSGLDFVAQIHANPRLAERITHIVLMTGHLELDDRVSRQLREAGVQTFLKPVQLSALIQFSAA